MDKNLTDYKKGDRVEIFNADDKFIDRGSVIHADDVGQEVVRIDYDGTAIYIEDNYTIKPLYRKENCE